MSSISLFVALISLATVLACNAEAMFEVLSALVEMFTAPRRAVDFEEWEMFSDDHEGVDGGEWPSDCFTPRSGARCGAFLPPVPFEVFWAALSTPVVEDVDALPALEVAARFLDIRREMFGGADEGDESVFLVEMACFLGAGGHGRRAGAHTLVATPDAAIYAARRTLAASVNVTVDTVAI